VNVSDKLASECYAAGNALYAVNARFIKSPILFSIHVTLSQFCETRLIQTCLSQSVSSRIQLGNLVDLLI
jgi:hypothetical protein